MIANPSGASGTGTSQRSMRNCSPAIHSNTTRPPATGGAPAKATCMVHSPMKRSSCLCRSSMVTMPPPEPTTPVFDTKLRYRPACLLNSSHTHEDLLCDLTGNGHIAHQNNSAQSWSTHFAHHPALLKNVGWRSTTFIMTWVE